MVGVLDGATGGEVGGALFATVEGVEDGRNTGGALGEGLLGDNEGLSVVESPFVRKQTGRRQARTSSDDRTFIIPQNSSMIVSFATYKLLQC